MICMLLITPQHMHSLPGYRICPGQSKRERLSPQQSDTAEATRSSMGTPGICEVWTYTASVSQFKVNSAATVDFPDRTLNMFNAVQHCSLVLQNKHALGDDRGKRLKSCRHESTKFYQTLFLPRRARASKYGTPKTMPKPMTPKRPATTCTSRDLVRDAATELSYLNVNRNWRSARTCPSAQQSKASYSRMCLLRQGMVCFSLSGTHCYIGHRAHHQ